MFAHDCILGGRGRLGLLQHFNIRGQAVAADALPDGSQLVVATYDTLWLFDVTDRDRPLDRPVAKLSYGAEQVEAVCFADPQTILLADELTAAFYEVSVADFTPLANSTKAEDD